MLPVFDVSTTTNFIHPKDTTDPKTIFSIGVIDAKAHAWIDKTFTQLSWTRDADGNQQPVVNIDRQGKSIELVKLGLKGATNFTHQLTFTVEKYPFGERTVLDEQSLNAVKPYIDAMAKAIDNNTNITPDDEKK